MFIPQLESEWILEVVGSHVKLLGDFGHQQIAAVALRLGGR